MVDKVTPGRTKVITKLFSSDEVYSSEPEIGMSVPTYPDRVIQNRRSWIPFTEKVITRNHRNNKDTAMGSTEHIIHKVVPSTNEVSIGEAPRTNPDKGDSTSESRQSTHENVLRNRIECGLLSLKFGLQPAWLLCHTGARQAV